MPTGKKRHRAPSGTGKRPGGTPFTPGPEGTGHRRGFKPGQSGNPGGLPKTVKAIRDLIGERTENGVELVDLACAAMRGKVEGVSREYAHAWLADRFFGRPKQQVDITASGEITLEHVAQVAALQLSPHERRVRAAELRARAALPAPSEEPAEPELSNGNGHAHES